MTLFHKVTLQWQQIGYTPTAISCSRQVNMAKQHKISNGSTNVADLRPINIYSLWYRWWSSSWAKNPALKEWRQNVMPAEVAGGPGSPGTEALAAKLNNALQTHGFLASMDYTLAFDFVSPIAATAAMNQLGLPRGLTQVLLYQWTHQSRFLQWQKSYSPEVLHTNISIPQGDPLSPLALNVIMMAGLRFVNNNAPGSNNNRLHMVYMDDRSFTASSPKALLETLTQWEHYSTLVGLKENQSKTQLTASNVHNLNALKRHLRRNHALKQHVASKAYILGSSTSTNDSTARNLHPKEIARLDAAKAVLRRIRFLPVAHSCKMQTAQLMATTKAAYGWIGHSPPKSEIQSFNKALQACSPAFKAASKPLTNMLSRAHLSLDAVIGRRQVLLWCKQNLQPGQPQLPAHIPSAILATTWLRDHGWSYQRRQQQWQHRNLNLTFTPQDSGTIDGYHNISHMLRESWRHKQWQDFRASSRRDATPFANTPYNTRRFNLVRQTVKQSTGAQLAVLLGSVISPAAFSKRPTTAHEHTYCPLCSEHMADLQHMYWSCPKRFTTSRPRDHLQARFGWPTNPTDIRTLEQLTQTVEVLWEHRHKDRLYGPRAYIPRFNRS